MDNLFRHTLPNFLYLLFIIASVLFVGGCGGDGVPVEHIQQYLRNAPNYSILLDDMKEEGNFFKEYFHKYRIVQQDLSRTTDWLEVPEDYYKTHASFLGMAIAGKKDGEVSSVAAPPGYQYVGDTRYGSWQNDSMGRSFWAFNRGNPLFDELDIDLHLPIYRKNYDAYKRSKSGHVPYYGPNNAYGTGGVFTKKAKPNFYARRMAKERVKTASFSDKVSKRIGRTRTSFRGRSGSRGK